MLNWSKFSKLKKTFGVIIWKWRTTNKLQTILSSDCRDKKLECYDWWEKLFDQLVRNDLITYDSIQKLAKGQGDDCATGSFLDYNCFKKYYKMIAINLSKQQALDVDPKAIQRINFTRNLENTAVIFFIIEEANEIVSRLRKASANNPSTNIKLSKIA